MSSLEAVLQSPGSTWKAVEFPFSVPDDTIGSFSAERDRIKVVLRASVGLGKKGFWQRDHAGVALVSQGERWDLGQEDGGRDGERGG